MNIQNERVLDHATSIHEVYQGLKKYHYCCFIFCCIFCIKINAKKFLNQYLLTDVMISMIYLLVHLGLGLYPWVQLYSPKKIHEHPEAGYWSLLNLMAATLSFFLYLSASKGRRVLHLKCYRELERPVYIPKAKTSSRPRSDDLGCLRCLSLIFHFSYLGFYLLWMTIIGTFLLLHAKKEWNRKGDSAALSRVIIVFAGICFGTMVMFSNWHLSQLFFWASIKPANEDLVKIDMDTRSMRRLENRKFRIFLSQAKIA